MFLFHIKFLLSYWAFHVISYFKNRNFHYCYICHKLNSVEIWSNSSWSETTKYNILTALDGILEIKFSLFIYQPGIKSILY